MTAQRDSSLAAFETMSEEGFNRVSAVAYLFEIRDANLLLALLQSLDSHEQTKFHPPWGFNLSDLLDCDYVNYSPGCLNLLLSSAYTT